RPEEFAHVQPEAFLAWQRREVAVYALGMWCSFAKVVVGFAFLKLVAPELPFSLVRAIGASIDLGWLAIVVITLVRGSRVRRERQRLGIILGGFVVSEPGEPGESRERSAGPLPNEPDAGSKPEKHD
ncbi:MAG TPA: hypothetical protein VLC09_05940, partial [Polyangiaceae bacterium]|nr:hypothetical protein [Polyangiaceae bacterium]